jgi:hypothetical protein
MTADRRNTAASVHQRLLNKARESSRPFNEILQHYAIERFIYRLSRSHHAEKFILKGALMFAAWSGLASRPTMDIDLLGRLGNSLDGIAGAMREACAVEVEADGMIFNGETVTTARITEEAEFGDVIVPGPTEVIYPSLLGLPAPVLKGYSMESAIAEKFQAMVKLGVLNSRMKDFYDIWVLSQSFDFNGEQLSQAIRRTFENRRTPLHTAPTVFEPSFAQENGKQVQWYAFIRKAHLTGAPEDFANVAAAIKAFLEPVVTALADGRAFREEWKALGPWR